MPSHLSNSLVVSLVFVTLLAAKMPLLAELKPNSPEVRVLIDRGMKWLETADDNRVGGQCLIAMCFLKEGADAKHPQIVKAIEKCQAACRPEAENIGMDMYSSGIAIVFLCEVDPTKYSTEIEKLVKSVIHRQKMHGGFGYPTGPHEATGDTSMTQYGVLGLWTAKKHGFAVPDVTAEKVCSWLIRTQDPNGGWGYQGVDPGDYTRVKQGAVRHSLCAAGLGSTYICYDLLGLVPESEDRSIEGLPPAFKKVVDKKPVDDKAKRLTVDTRMLRRATTDGNRWFATNFKIEQGSWVHYYMYALERCMSFRELVEKRSVGTGWYDTGVRFLAKSQFPDGHWESNAGASVDTAFAILFLLRSTQKTIITISKQYDGVLVGGHGLPTNTANVRIKKGQVVGVPLSGGVDEILSILEDPDSKDFEYVIEFPGELAITSKEPKERAVQFARLARVINLGPVDAKLVAINALARSGDISVAPILITALEQSEARTVIAAREGLKRLSRKFDGFGPGDASDEGQRRISAEEWRVWYRSVHPNADAEFQKN